MNILYCGDRNIEDGLILSILSLLKNIKEELKIYVLTANIETEEKNFVEISDELIDYINKYIKKNNVKNEIKKIDITNLYLNELPISNMKTRFTPCCMFRLFADEIEELPNKILYLDTDVLCRKDCSEFYNQDISNYEFVGTLDYYGRWFFRNNLLKMDYINSGVLLINLEKVKETKLFKKCREMCQKKEMFMPDQSALNKLGKQKKIEKRKFNEQRKIHKNTVLQHFTTSFRLFPWLHTLTVKPWQIDEMHKKLKITEYDDILEEYIKIKKDIIRREE